MRTKLYYCESCESFFHFVAAGLSPSKCPQCAGTLYVAQKAVPGSMRLKGWPCEPLWPCSLLSDNFF